MITHQSYKPVLNITYSFCLLRSNLSILCVFLLITSQGFSLSSKDPQISNIITHPVFLNFIRGNNRRIIDQATSKTEILRNTYGKSRLDPLEFFQTETEFQKQNVKNLMKSYLRFFHSKQYIVTPPNKYPTLHNSHKLVPILQLEDGQKNQYLLQRISDTIFDLILLEHTDRHEQYSGKKIENYNIFDFIELARVTHNNIIRLSLYKDGSFELPQRTNLEIPIPPLSMIHLLALKKQAEDAELLAEKKRREVLLHKLNQSKRADHRIQQLKRELHRLRLYQNEELSKKIDLVKMRLNYLDLSKVKTQRDITLIVQADIIEKIFEAEPIAKNCPGTISSEGYCYPDGDWDDNTWRLYRKLYKIPNVTALIYPTPNP